MTDIFQIKSVKFSMEQKMKDEVVLKFSNKQGGDFNVFSYHWQCFAWAAIVGFIYCDPLPLESPIADKSFSLNTMINNDGERIAEALICMSISKSNNLSILKQPEEVIKMINEYANAGFHRIQKDIANNGGLSNDFQYVTREVFSRKV